MIQLLVSRHGPSLLLLALGVLVLVRLARALPWSPRPGRRSLPRCESGAAATLGFVLVFPFFVMILLVVAQFALLVHARILVSYAAFAAARSAVVWADAEREVAVAQAEDAAAVALLPVSPSYFERLGLPNPPVPSSSLLLVHAGDYGSVAGDSSLGRVWRRFWRLGGKRTYARLWTRVELEPEDPGPQDPLTATVSYRFYLSVPYADGVFAALPGGSRLPPFPTLSMRDSVTLLNQGRVRTESVE